MPISDLLRRKNMITVQYRMVQAASRLQKWWRNHLEARKSAFGPTSIYEVKKMLDKVCMIQKWYRALVVKWA